MPCPFTGPNMFCAWSLDLSFGKFFDQNIHWFGRIHEFIFKENLVENTFDTGQFLEKQFCM